MAEFNAEVAYAKLEQNVKSNQHRIDEMGEKIDNLQEIVICIREIAVEMKGMKEAQDEIKRNQEKSNEEIKKSQEKSQEEFRRSQEQLAEQIRAVEKAPDKKAASYVDKAVNAAIAAIVAFVMTNILGK